MAKLNAQEALELLEAVRSGEYEDSGLEVKRAQRGLPQRLFETLSAFANQAGGGVILLGIDESQGFRHDRRRSCANCAQRAD